MTAPIAIIGVACRFPGAPSVDAYWDLLRRGTDAVREPPPGRPELEPPPWLVEQAPSSRRGGFLEELDRFEPGFFRLSPREAARMDPQQRLLLETAWEALEDAGQPAARLAGTSTGVFVGVMNADFARRHAQDPSNVDAHLGTGSSLGIAPNRLSFFLDIRGPSMAIDTLCSSSLVAIHLACQSLLADESTPLAIAGGVNVILDRTMDVFYARAGLLSRDGRCRAFDGGACGIVRGEGVGLLVLKPLSRARADGDRIHAVIRGSAVNQDGRSNGLTSPSRWSQEAVLRAAYRRAGVEPSRVPYVEAHGTGTLIGDPIEAAALGAVLGDGRTADRACTIGSVKTNLGHLESAAGLAGIVKAVLCLERRMLVPSLHFEAPNPYARLDERLLRVVTRTEPWPDAERLAGVSSFGMGGTNAHVVLAADDGETPAQAVAANRTCVVPLSARSPPALDVLEDRTRGLIAEATVPLADLAHSAGVRRDHHDLRRALVVRPDRTVAHVVSGGVVPGRAHALVFVLPTDVPCDGSVGRELAETDPAFRVAFQQSRAEGATPLVALQAALLASFRALGFEPTAVVRTARDDLAAVARHLVAEGTVFVELSPQPAMLDPLRGLLERAGVPGSALASIEPGRSERESMLLGVARMYVLGVDVDWRRLDTVGARFASLGTYPWQREHCWLDLSPPPAASVLPRGLLVESWVRSKAVTGGPPLARTQDWLVVADGGDTAGDVASGLETLGHRVRLARELDVPSRAAPPDHVVFFSNGHLPSLVRLVQALARRTDGPAQRLWLVTRGACVLAGDTDLESLAGAKTWGFGRVAANELPRLRCTLVDLPATPTTADGERLVRELSHDGDEREVAFRGSERHVARLGRRTLADSPTSLRLRADAAYVVTGGLGGLGMAAARRLADRGAGTLVLVGRRGAAKDEARSFVRELEGRGQRVVVEQTDVADRSAVAEVFRRHRVRGIVHAAGVMSPAMVAAIEPGEIDAATRAKVDGARWLHELSLGEPLDFFVLYSSIATLLGMPGQAVYAAANAYLDALAAHRRALGLTATSVAWTVIEGTGMAASAGKRALEQLADRGVATLGLHHATDLLERFLGDATPPHVGAVSFDLGRWSSFHPHAQSMPRLAPLADPERAQTDEPLASAWRALPFPERSRTIEAHLSKVVSEVLQHPAPLDPQASLLDIGIDSMTAIELQTMLEAIVDVSIPTERLLRGPSLRELAGELASLLDGARVPSKPAAPRLRDDAVLEDAMTFAPRASRPATPAIFLTGATGFLGAFVLAELLERTQATIRCLVRARSETEGRRRLEATLGRYGLPAPTLASRVRCVPGDLAQERFGLGAADFERLSQSVDTIVHSGAAVNFVFPYEALAPSNVGGTKEILRFASLAQARLHHVSTVGVFRGGREAPERVSEDAAPGDPERLPLGYMQAKWVAEALVVEARRRGLDVSIYRPGTIAGHSATGAFNPDDFLCALIKGCIQLGLSPRVDVPISLAPVDYVSRAIVQIAFGVGCGGGRGTYHLVGPHPVAWSDIVGWVRALGYRLDDAPYPEWRRILVERAEATGNALLPLLPLFAAHDDTSWLVLPAYDDRKAARALAGSGVVCPAVDAPMMRRFVERFVSSDYLPPPP